MATPHAAPGNTRRALLAITVLAGLLQPSPASPEVWPVAAAAVVLGPNALLEAGPLALWSNPALISRGPGWSAGAGWLEPFSVPLLARTDAAASHRWRDWGLAAGATRFGGGEFSASALALGLATTLATGRADGGVTLRRHTRRPDDAWAVDLGLALVPHPSLRIGVVSRSAVRAGRLETAPEPEWEIAASWQRGPATVSAALVRDAVGPIARTVAARLTLDRTWLQLTASELAAGEARFSLGVGVRLAGLTAAVGRETGPILPESRAVLAGWQASGTAAPLLRAATGVSEVPPLRSANAGPPRTTATTADAGADSLLGETGDYQVIERELDADPELLEEEGESVLDRWGGGDDNVPPDPAPVKVTAVPQTPLRVRASWRWTIGGRAQTASGLGVAGGGAVWLTGPTRLRLAVRTALSRDIGEPAGFDEHRITLETGWLGAGRLLVGSIDTGFGAALTLAEPASGPGTRRLPLVRLTAAARPTRSRVPAAAGAGVILTPAARLRFLLWSAVIPRDARLTASGLWSTGGRYHRSETELSRRGVLSETARGAAIEWSSRSGDARLALLAVHTRYRSAAPRLLPEGWLLERGAWFAAATRLQGSRTDVLTELALAPTGRLAGVFRLRTRSPGRNSPVSGELLYLTRTAGFAAATAWPTAATRSRLSLRLNLTLWQPALRLSLAEGYEDRWSPPGTTIPARRRWSREDRAALRLARGRNVFTLEWSRRRSWQHPPNSGDPSVLPQVRPRSWSLGADWRWRPGGEAVAIGLGHSLRGTGGNLVERWEVFCAGKRRIEWRLAVSARPGAARDGAVQVEGDPLGGLRFAPSSSPSRVRLRLSLPVAGSRHAAGELSSFALRGLAIEGLWGVSSRGPRLEVWCTVIGGHPEDRAPALR